MVRFTHVFVALILGLMLLGCQRDRMGYIVVNPTNVDVEDLLNAPEQFSLDGTTLVVKSDLVLDLMPKIGPPYETPALQVHWEITATESQGLNSVKIKPRQLWVVCQEKVMTASIQALEGRVKLDDVCDCDSNAIVVVLFDYNGKSILLRSPWLRVVCAH